MMITTPTQESMQSLVDLFTALRDDPRMNVGQGIVAIGRPEPEVRRIQRPHVRVAYDRGRSPFGEDKTFVVHTAWVTEDGELSLGSGHYDLTRDEAWAMVSGKKTE